MTKEEITRAAYTVLAYKHLGRVEAMERVLGKFSESNAHEFNAVHEEIENILHPHGTGEDAAYCEY